MKVLDLLINRLNNRQALKLNRFEQRTIKALVKKTSRYYHAKRSALTLVERIQCRIKRESAYHLYECEFHILKALYDISNQMISSVETDKMVASKQQESISNLTKDLVIAIWNKVRIKTQIPAEYAV